MHDDPCTDQGSSMTHPPSAITVQSVSKSFGRGDAAIRVLQDVSVEIGAREFFTLLGPSGCGKTTLLRLIAGFEDLNSGSILIEGARIDHLPPFQRPVNTVFQNYALFPHLTVAQNVAFALEMQNLSTTEVRRRAGEALEMVRMGALAARKPSELSGGQQQRVALARALAPRPKVLLLDEPLSALDLKLRKEMQIELKQLQTEAGITFVFVTHDQEEALTLSDRIAVMQGGRILQLDTPRAIYERPAHRFVADFIGEINLLDGLVCGPGRVRLDCGAEIAVAAEQTAWPGLRAGLPSPSGPNAPRWHKAGPSPPKLPTPPIWAPRRSCNCGWRMGRLSFCARPAATYPKSARGLL